MVDPLFLSLLFPLFISSIAAQSNTTNYPTCPSHDSCNGLTISYPFWRMHDNQTQFCGYQGFGINCSTTINRTDLPIIKLGNNSYFVHEIIYRTTSIILVDYDVSPIVIPVPNHCPRVLHNNIDFQSLPFSFTEFNANLSFHINCNGIPDFATKIPCLESDSGRRKSCVNLVRNEPKDFNWSTYSCDEHVVKTVLNNDNLPDGDRLGREYGGVLSRGFELQWRSLEDCGKCEESNGWCGHNSITGESMCFCSDGRTTTDHCKTKKGTFIMTPTSIKFQFYPRLVDFMDITSMTILK
ncbi:hypothetical protein L6452_15388 [Arctium lappa]|uniref:Uncharacterized protein n=1 Tax=Arctium lappa TaxID=4217 RepID=A0ACB9CP74_ARCLA|nr:hypothetical protein L6452_15388 [Arctium lappa]